MTVTLYSVEFPQFFTPETKIIDRRENRMWY